MLIEKLEMKVRLNRLVTLWGNHKRRVDDAWSSCLPIRDEFEEMTEEFIRIWDALDVFYDALIDVRNEALEGFKESEGNDAYKVIIDLAQAALDKVTESGKLREKIVKD